MACRCCTLRTVRTKRPARGTLSHPTYIIRNISSLELSSAFRARLSSWALAAQPGPSWIRRPHAVLLPTTARLGPLLPSHPPPPSRLETSFARRLSRPFAAPAPSGHSLPGPGTAVGLLAWDIAGSIHQPSIPPSTHPNPPTQHRSSPRPASHPHALAATTT
ncbi:hypothetical protein MHUMG1_05978 [Metarhizium humberi]|uniref:Uncharacterized protein n=1 Tax=Metarhizium humberi TaxID=2596975 RepID=A0A9P8S6R5_9HYPO|nr:hypothetical protein MHUMG1_05978 [Metarhizium humberi]